MSNIITRLERRNEGRAFVANEGIRAGSDGLARQLHRKATLAKQEMEAARRYHSTADIAMPSVGIPEIPRTQHHIRQLGQAKVWLEELTQRAQHFGAQAKYRGYVAELDKLVEDLKDLAAKQHRNRVAEMVQAAVEHCAEVTAQEG